MWDFGAFLRLFNIKVACSFNIQPPMAMLLSLSGFVALLSSDSEDIGTI